MCEFERIAQQVEQDLAQTRTVAYQRVGQEGRHVKQQLQPFLLHLAGQQGGQLLQCCGE